MQPYKELLLSEDYKGVIEALKDKHDRDTQESMALGIAYFKTTMLQNAEKEFKALYIKDENNAFICLRLGDVYRLDNQRDKAIYFYRKAMRFSTTKDEAEEALGELGYSPEVSDEDEKITEVQGFRPKFNFSEVAGMERQKKYLKDHIIFGIEHPKEQKKYVKKTGMGLMMYGPPGNGKTFISEAVAGESKCYMIVAKQSDIIGQYLGTPEKNLRAIFAQGKANAPCLIFFDEFDSIGTKRSDASGSDKHGGGTHIKKMVAELLIQLQGIDKSQDAILVMVGTNRPWDIDPALRRSGRLEDSLYVAPPNAKEREESLKLHLNGRPQKEINLKRVARATIGFSHADIEKLVEDTGMRQSRADVALNKEQPITTKALLSQAKGMDNSLDAWFIDAKRELMGRKKTETINGKKMVTQEAGALEPQERKMYRPLIKDIEKNTSPLHNLIKRTVRSVAIYLW